MRIITSLFAMLPLLVSLFMPTPSVAHAQAHPVLVVVVGLKTNLTDISLAMLRRAFQGEVAHTTDGKRLVPLNHAVGSEERTRFDQAVLGLSPSEVGRFWINRRIRDEAPPPRTLPSADLGVRVVASYPGAIAYVNSTQVTSNIRVVRIDGKLPGDAGYLLAGR